MVWGSEPRTVGVASSGRRRTARQIVVAAVMTLGFGLCALVTGASIGLSTGWLAAIVGLLFAVIPLGIVVPSVIWVDRFEHEPVRLLVLAFAYGASVAAAVSLLLNTGSMAVISGVTGQDPTSVGAVAVAPVVEETAKGLGIVLVWALNRDEFDGVVDGVVYAAIVAAGFAFAENILYLGRAFAELGGAGLVATFVLRGLLGPFAHPLFTSWTGIGCGIAATARRPWVRWVAPVVGWLVAMALHSLWNLTAAAGANGYLATYALTQVPIFAVFVGVALWSRHREGRLIATNLSRYSAAGWLTPAEVAMVSSLAARRQALAWSQRIGGPAARRGMDAFQDDAATLALLRVRIDARGPSPESTERERSLLTALGADRQLAMGRPASPVPPATAPAVPDAARELH